MIEVGNGLEVDRERHQRAHEQPFADDVQDARHSGAGAVGETAPRIVLHDRRKILPGDVLGGQLGTPGSEDDLHLAGVRMDARVARLRAVRTTAGDCQGQQERGDGYALVRMLEHDRMVPAKRGRCPPSQGRDRGYPFTNMTARPWSASSPTRDGSPPPTKRLGFFDGVSAFFGGLGFIVGRPSMWGWAIIPTFVATVLFFGLGALAVWGGSSLAEHVLWDPGDGAWTVAGIWALRVVFWLVGIVVSFLVALSLAQPLSGFALDAIARRQELALGGRTWPDQPFFASMLRSLRVTLTALVVSLPMLGILAAITFLVPPASVVTIPAKFLVTGLAVAYDFLDYPLGLRGAGVRSRLGFIRDHFSAVIGFGAAAALLLLVPGLGLVLLPFGVAGAARLVVAADRTRA